MTAGRPPAAVGRAFALALVQAVVFGGPALLVLLLTLATYTQDDPPDGRTLTDVAGPLALLTGAVVLTVAVALAAYRFRRASEPGRRALVVLESAVVLAGLVLGVVCLRYGPAAGLGVGVVVLAPAALALAASTGTAARGWCR